MAKYITATLFAFILIITALLLALLLPAHMQIGKIKAEIPPLETVKAIFSDIPAEQLPSGIQYINTATQTGPFGTLGHTAVLIRWPSGKSFLIDTGMDHEAANDFGKTLEWLGADESETFGSVVEQLGSEVGTITGLGFTHLHTDHTQGVREICAEEVLATAGSMIGKRVVFQTELQHTQHNHLTREGQSWVKSSACDLAVLEDGSVIKAVPGFPALFAIEAGGHTPGSTIFITRFDGQVWVFAGDISNSMEYLLENKEKGWLYSNLLVPEETELLEKWRLWLTRLNQQQDVNVLVAHDIRAFDTSGLQAMEKQ